MSRDPVDKPERDAAVRFPERSRFVEAGAGTGKTTTMVARMVESVRRGIPLDKQVAVTFTVKAAFEIVDRLRKELAKDPGLAASLQDLSRMRVGTIDSVVQGLLEEYGVEADVAGGFRILGEAEFRSRFNAWFDEALRTWNRRNDLAGAWDCLQEMEFELRDRRRLLRDLALVAVGDGADVRAPRVEDIGDLVDGWCMEWRPALADPAKTDAKYQQRLSDETTRFDRMLATLRAGGIPDDRPFQSLGNLGGQTAKDQRQALTQANKALDQIVGMARYAVIAPLVEAVVEDARAFSRDLFAAGHLRFGFALRAAVDMLASRSDVCESVRAGIGSVYVDEFQDTSPDQVRFMNLLADDGAIPLFLVGDPKQSIYRFRGADVEGYLRERDRGGARGVATGSLTVNFRSAAPVLDTVNRLFSRRFEAPGGPGYQALVAHRETGETSHVVRIVRDTDGAPPHGGIGRCAEFVVGRIVAALSDRWSVVEKDAVRPIRPSDIAVLYPSRTGLAELRARLSAAGVPYRVEGATDLMATDEVRAVVSVLRAAAAIGHTDSRVRRLSRGTAWSSLAFGCPPEELALRLDADGGKAPVSDVAVDAEDTEVVDSEEEAASGGSVSEVGPLRELTGKIRHEPPSRAVAMVMAKRELIGLAGGHPRPRSVVNRLRSLMDRAIAAERDGVVRLADFVAWLDSDPEWNESPSPETDEDSVRLMTVHASKGLEFPMVCVHGFGSKGASFNDNVLVERDGTVRLRWKAPDDQAIESPGWTDAADAVRVAEAAERDRLLYVAMTRARDHLLVGVHGAKGSKQPSGDDDPVRETLADALLAHSEPDPREEGDGSRTSPRSCSKMHSTATSGREPNAAASWSPTM